MKIRKRCRESAGRGALRAEKLGCKVVLLFPSSANVCDARLQSGEIGLKLPGGVQGPHPILLTQ